MIASNKSFYLPNLDALRGLAALGVVFYHLDNWIGFKNIWLSKIFTVNWQSGPLAVQFFFVLSGFLITLLLLREVKQKGKISIGKFYVRRVLRIWPVYYITIVIGFVVIPFLKINPEDEIGVSSSFGMYSIFLANFDNIFSRGAQNGILGVQWSVAIEEQFYLIWPLLLGITTKWKNLSLLVLIGIFLASQGFKIYSQDVLVKYYHFFSCVRYLAFGGILAILEFKLGISSFFKSMSPVLIASIYMLVLSTWFFEIDFFKSQLSELFSDLLSTFFFGFVIFDQVYSKKSIVKVGSIGVLNWLGKMSYGLYLYHMIPILLFSYYLDSTHPWLTICLSLGGAIFLSWVSYNLIESRILKYKKKFQT